MTARRCSLRSHRRAGQSRSAVVALLLVLAAGCGDNTDGTAGAELVVYVSAPVTAAPWLATGLERGARLGVEEVNAKGGLGKDRRRLRLVVGDHHNTVQGARDRAADAVREGAVLFLTDGVGVVKASEITATEHIPTVITFDGGEGLLDEEKRPHVFRLAPANKPMTRRLADYLAEKRPKLAVLHDDSSYGVDGVADLARGLATNRIVPTVTVQIPSSAADVAPQVLRARRSGADTVVVWARAPVVAAVVRAMRGTQWAAPIYAGPTAEDPLVRQQLADHAEWLDGLTFVSFRITSEVGPVPFSTFRAAYEKRFGVEQVGVGDVVMPPDYAMYPYDAIQLLAAAYPRAESAGQALLDAFGTVSITGANGDERGFTPANHEGVSPDDMYFAQFQDLRFAPVQDDSLSKNLPTVPQ